ncbi:MAG TPA: ATP-dependent Clp protease proteolytic subunit [Methylomirabilota bacterium]
MRGGPRGGPTFPPGAGGPPDWLREALFARRIIVITGRLDDDAASHAAAQIMLLDAASAAPIEIHLDGPDGTLEAAFVLIDTFEAARAPIRVHCRGRVGGPAVGVVAVGGHRSASPHARFRLGEPTVTFSGTPEETLASTRRYRDLLWQLQARIARATGRPAEEIADDMRRGRWLDAEDALVYGLIDAVAPPRAR